MNRTTLSPGKQTQVLAGYLSKIEVKDIPHPILERAKMCILDWMGATISGFHMSSARAVRNFVLEQGGTEEATVFGVHQRVPATQAALANGVASHAQEIDDTSQFVHGGAVVVSAALATGEKVKTSGKKLFLAVVMGYEIAKRLSKAAGISHYQYWHSTATCGTFGAAAAAGKLLGLNKKQFLSTLGLAGTQASGLWESLNSKAISCKSFHAGKAAMNGILAAQLAKVGITGSPTILEGVRGFFAATTTTTPQDAAQQVIWGLGETYEILDNIVKLHACCLGNHRAINAAIELHNKFHLQPNQISSICVKETPRRIEMCGITNPHDIKEAKFSLPFSVAIALKYGKAGLREYSKETINDNEVRGLMAKTILVGDPNTLLHGNAEEVITLETTNGRVLKQSGNISFITKKQVESKFIDIVKLYCPGETGEDICYELNNITEAASIERFIEKVQTIALKAKNIYVDSSP